jgi:hypothetical protein|tara:strand:- start:388 stop:540 length:153 start_codon:yes stop_codon:yes gene_type:complete
MITKSEMDAVLTDLNKVLKALDSRIIALESANKATPTVAPTVKKTVGGKK